MLVGCPSKTVSNQGVDRGLSDETDLGMSEVDQAPPCSTVDQCSQPECAAERICQPCEDGGNCLFTGELRIVGRALSRRNQTISDLTITATCGAASVSTEPEEGGFYELNLRADQCSHLVVISERAEGTEGYVPVVKRFQMPPPVNTIELDIRMIEGDEIRCDGTLCSSGGSRNEFDPNRYQIAYAHDSESLSELSNFGSIFESTSGELLWLHRFAYRDFRNDQSQTLYDIFFYNNSSGLYALAGLNFDTRDWITDLATGITAFDYHSRPYSRYWEEDKTSNWNERSAELTDSQIDPDGDGQYETIEMYTYQLNFERAQWEPVVVDGAPLYSRIFAEIETGYNTISDEDFTLTIPDALYSPRKIKVLVPDLYLRSVQSTGEYGPGYLESVSTSGSNQGFYGRDYTGIPITGSGVFAVGQPIPKACFKVVVQDECSVPILGIPISTRGINHGYVHEAFTNDQGVACIEVGRSEAGGQDYDGDGLSNERFDVEISAGRKIGSNRTIPPQSLIESTPIEEGSCRTPDSCEALQITFSNCQ